LSAFEATEHSLKVTAACHTLKIILVKGVEAHIEASHACIIELRSKALKEVCVGGERELLYPLKITHTTHQPR
jgi:hypothetical protein